MQMHTFIHANCITVETHPATRPVDTLVPQSQHTLTDQNPIQGNKAEMPKAKTKKKNQFKTSQNEEAATMKGPLF